jgi:DinB superfamily
VAHLKIVTIMASTPNETTQASVSGDDFRDSVPLALPGITLLNVERARTLDELEAQFTAISRAVKALIDSAGADLCSTRPAPGSWSAAECLQHLNITADAYFPIWQQTIANAGPRKTELNAPYSTDFCGRLFSWILDPPARIRSKTPAPFQPVDRPDISLALAGFLDRQQRILATLRRCRGRAIDKVKMGSPVDAKIRYSIWSSFVIIAAHQRRHLWQAEQAVRKLGGAEK